MMNHDQETVKFIFSSLLNPGLASLTMHYTGCLLNSKFAAGAARKVLAQTFSDYASFNTIQLCRCFPAGTSPRRSRRTIWRLSAPRTGRCSPTCRPWRLWTTRATEFRPSTPLGWNYNCCWGLLNNQIRKYRYWSVRRLKASPTPPCGIFNIIISGMRGLGIQIVVLLLSCCLVLLSCQSIKRWTKTTDWQ